MTPTLIVTRPAAQSASFAAQIAAAWGKPLQIIQSPLVAIAIVPAKLSPIDEVIFTSLNGVEASKQFGLPKGMRAWCVGERTAQAAQEAGFTPTTGAGDADALVGRLLSAHSKGTLAHIRGKHARGDVAARLQAAGMTCQDVIAYDQTALDLTSEARDALNAQTPVIFPLFSPRTSTILSKQGPFSAPLHAVALSGAVAKAIDPALNMTCSVATTPDAAAMTNAVLAVLESLTSQ